MLSKRRPRQPLLVPMYRQFHPREQTYNFFANFRRRPHCLKIWHVPTTPLPLNRVHERGAARPALVGSPILVVATLTFPLVRLFFLIRRHHRHCLERRRPPSQQEVCSQNVLHDRRLTRKIRVVISAGEEGRQVCLEQRDCICMMYVWREFVQGHAHIRKSGQSSVRIMNHAVVQNAAARLAAHLGRATSFP